MAAINRRQVLHVTMPPSSAAITEYSRRSAAVAAATVFLTADEGSAPMTLSLSDTAANQGDDCPCSFLEQPTRSLFCPAASRALPAEVRRVLSRQVIDECKSHRDRADARRHDVRASSRMPTLSVPASNTESFSKRRLHRAGLRV